MIRYLILFTIIWSLSCTRPATRTEILNNMHHIVYSGDCKYVVFYANPYSAIAGVHAGDCPNPIHITKQK